MFFRSDILLSLFISLALTSCYHTREPESPVDESPKMITPIRSDPWILIDGRTEVVSVISKGNVVATFENAAFGAAGIRDKQKRGDDVTPKGLFSVTRVSHASKYSIFIGLNYPRIEDAERGLRNGVISRPVFTRIVGAHQRGANPPQDTPLGGHIGIHGVGKGSPEIHAMANWTAGCVALTNTQIRQLAQFVRPGVEVEIRY